MSGDFEEGLKRARPEEESGALREKTLSRAGREALDPFAASLRRLVPEPVAPELRARVLAAAARERTAARRARMVHYAAAAVVAVCISVNLRVGNDPEPDRVVQSGPSSAWADLSPEVDRYLRLQGMIRGRQRDGVSWFSALQSRRRLAWSVPFSKG